MKLQDGIKLLIPPILILIAKRLFKKGSPYGLTGDYNSWDKAVADSTGYDIGFILEKTKTALLKVKNGEAAYERDTVLFDHIEYAWPVLAGLFWVAARHGGVLNVLDFGGSLGSTYFQNQIFLSALSQVRWNIIEQPHYVEAGKMWFEDDCLHFYADIVNCLSETQPNVVLLGSVLQYLEHPYLILNKMMDIPCDLIIIDRTPFWSGLNDRICIQTVSPDIYPASYPSWIFSKKRFFSYLKVGWKVMEIFDNIDSLNGPVNFSYQGALLVNNTNLS